MADLVSVLATDPNLAGSLYLRGLVLRRQGKTADGDRSLAAATLIAPRIADNYRPFGIVP